MENPDLRKEAIDAIKSINGELKGLIVLATDENKSSVCIGGNPTTIVNLLAGAMMQDPKVLALVHEATQAIAAKMMTEIVASKLN